MGYPGREDSERGRAAGIGVLISNLGTPEAATAAAVRPWLRQFLSDPRVVELPRLPWLLLLNCVVLLTRPARSAKAYRSIWTAAGSPLALHTRAQAQALQQLLRERHGDQLELRHAFRYGRPSLADGVQALLQAGADRLLVLPLYPQYSSATGGSTFDAIAAELRKCRRVPDLRLLSHYHDQPGYIQLLADAIREYQRSHGVAQQLLLSFHGLPQRSVEQGDPYYNQCRNTAHLLAGKLGLRDDQYLVTFQSRFGAAQWLQPYTGDALVDLARNGTRSVQVVCPGFAADCLETLEEVAIGYRQVFLDNGGEQYQYIPALNASAPHIRFLADLIGDNLRGWLDERTT